MCVLAVSCSALRSQTQAWFIFFPLLMQNQYNLARAQQSYKSLVQIHEKNGECRCLQFNTECITDLVYWNQIPHASKLTDIIALLSSVCVCVHPTRTTFTSMQSTSLHSICVNDIDTNDAHTVQHAFLIKKWIHQNGLHMTPMSNIYYEHTYKALYRFIIQYGHKYSKCFIIVSIIYYKTVKKDIRSSIILLHNCPSLFGVG